MARRRGGEPRSLMAAESSAVVISRKVEGESGGIRSKI